MIRQAPRMHQQQMRWRKAQIQRFRVIGGQGVNLHNQSQRNKHQRRDKVQRIDARQTLAHEGGKIAPRANASAIGVHEHETGEHEEEIHQQMEAVQRIGRAFQKLLKVCFEMVDDNANGRKIAVGIQHVIALCFSHSSGSLRACWRAL